MSFDLNVWNGMSDAERLQDFVRVMEERDMARSRLAERELDWLNQCEQIKDQQARLAVVEASRDGWEADAKREAGNAAHYKAQLAEAERERDENEGVFKVWRRRCEDAEARLAEAEALIEKLTMPGD